MSLNSSESTSAMPGQRPEKAMPYAEINKSDSTSSAYSRFEKPAETKNIPGMEGGLKGTKPANDPPANSKLPAQSLAEAYTAGLKRPFYIIRNKTIKAQDVKKDNIIEVFNLNFMKLLRKYAKTSPELAQLSLFDVGRLVFSVNFELYGCGNSQMASLFHATNCTFERFQAMTQQERQVFVKGALEMNNLKGQHFTTRGTAQCAKFKVQPRDLYQADKLFDMEADNNCGILLMMTTSDLIVQTPKLIDGTDTVMAYDVYLTLEVDQCMVSSRKNDVDGARDFVDAVSDLTKISAMEPHPLSDRDTRLRVDGSHLFGNVSTNHHHLGRDGTLIAADGNEAEILLAAIEAGKSTIPRFKGVDGKYYQFNDGLNYKKEQSKSLVCKVTTFRVSHPNSYYTPENLVLNINPTTKSNILHFQLRSANPTQREHTDSVSVIYLSFTSKADLQYTDTGFSKSDYIIYNDGDIGPNLINNSNEATLLKAKFELSHKWGWTRFIITLDAENESLDDFIGTMSVENTGVNLAFFTPTVTNEEENKACMQYLHSRVKEGKPLTAYINDSFDAMSTIMEKLSQWYATSDFEKNARLMLENAVFGFQGAVGIDSMNYKINNDRPLVAIDPIPGGEDITYLSQALEYHQAEALRQGKEIDPDLVKAVIQIVIIVGSAIYDWYNRYHVKMNDIHETSNGFETVILGPGINAPGRVRMWDMSRPHQIVIDDVTEEGPTGRDYTRYQGWFQDHNSVGVYSDKTYLRDWLADSKFEHQVSHMAEVYGLDRDTYLERLQKSPIFNS